ncbi:MAG: alcohol dehydrogenase catalytic domain-containing protein [Candidatus Solibacter usitatus]|nr:alcohol dehydrogenase catalytic domain-containing protein [Candidatus Solibacter usitatus]
MVSAELIATRQFRLTNSTIPNPAPGEIQVLVKAVGICGSDLHYYFEGGIGDTPCVYPMVLGHEPAGEVLRTGDGVTGWTAGSHAVLEPAIFCYHCEFCRTGHHNVCSHLRFLSQPSDPGFFREVVNLPAANVLPLPRHLSFSEGALAEPLAIALHSLKFALPAPGDTVAVFGAGPIGLMTVAALRLSGVARVWAVEPVAHRREMALHMGADAVIDPQSEDVTRRIRQDTGQRGVDIAIDCATKNGTMNLCLRITRNAGRVVYTGIPSEPAVALEFHEVRRKELALYAVRRSNHETEMALRILAERPAFFAPLLTHHVTLDRIAYGFELLENYSEGVGKVTVTPS